MLKSGGNFSGDARYEGFCIDLLKEIARMVGFTYRIELVPDGKYGVYDYETGEWNGIVRQLMDKVSVWTGVYVRTSASLADYRARIVWDSRAFRASALQHVRKFVIITFFVSISIRWFDRTHVHGLQFTLVRRLLIPFRRWWMRAHTRAIIRGKRISRAHSRMAAFVLDYQIEEPNHGGWAEPGDWR